MNANRATQRSTTSTAVAADGKDVNGRRGMTKASGGGTAGAAAAASSNSQRQTLAASKGTRSEAESVFERLRGFDKGESSGDALGAKGLQQLFSELGVAEDSLESYVVLWRLGATRKGSLSRAEWLVFWYTYNIDQLTQCRLKVAEWTQEVKENREDAFTVMYNYMYDYVRGESDRQMTVASATAAWAVLLKGIDAKLMQSWLQWVSQEYHRPVSRDLWRQAWLFLSRSKGPSVAERTHDAGMWPTAIDDFVSWMKKQTVSHVN